MPTRFVPNQQGIRELFSRSGIVGRHIAGLGEKTERRAKTNINSKSGELRSSARTVFSSTAAGATSTISFNAPYALYYHEGTRPHSIGSPVYIRDILGWRYIGLSPAGRGRIHPGTTGNPFLLDALEDVIRQG